MTELDIVEIERIEEETPTIKTIFFDWGGSTEPGQFVMVWIPGVDEIPMAISKEKLDFITVKKRGEATKKLHKMEPGDKLGIRGPYGEGYDIEGDKMMIVTGGCGGASLMEAVRSAAEKGIEMIICLGAETEEELLFRDRYSEMAELRVATDDGTAGHHGFVTEITEEVVEKEEIDSVLTCGPEIMMRKVVDMCVEREIPIQASLERYMKCGIGLCDSCTIDGKQVCIDGPVFKGGELKEMDEFGEFERTKEGLLVRL
ncbi:MAG: dihydroorotate dehydrogenase electron transfer subunit [Candidatus Aenigmatarchaeota archaeon]